MVSESDIHDEYERLWENYTTCLECADSLDSPNADDNRFIKMAIIGFSYHDATSSWSADNFEIASRYLAESESLDDLDSMKLYSMLALGSLLGMYSAGKIDDHVYRIGYALLPRFVMGKGGAVHELPS